MELNSEYHEFNDKNLIPVYPRGDKKFDSLLEEVFNKI